MKEEIPNRLVDTTTIVKNHTWYTHLVCIIIRILLGLFLLSHSELDNNTSGYLIIFMMIIVVMFAMKFKNNSNTWKVYLRTVVAYSLSALLINNKKNKEAGMVVIIDALLGLQSRHTATLFNS